MDTMDAIETDSAEVQSVEDGPGSEEKPGTGHYTKCGVGKRIAVKAMRVIGPVQGQALLGPHWATKTLLGTVLRVEKRSRIVRFEMDKIKNTKISARFLTDLDQKVGDVGFLDNPNAHHRSHADLANTLLAGSSDMGFPASAAMPHFAPSGHAPVSIGDSQADILKLAQLGSSQSVILNASADEKAIAYEKLSGLRDALQRRVAQVTDLMTKISEVSAPARITDLASSHHTQLANKLMSQQWAAMQQWVGQRYALASQFSSVGGLPGATGLQPNPTSFGMASMEMLNKGAGTAAGSNPFLLSQLAQPVNPGAGASAAATASAANATTSNNNNNSSSSSKSAAIPSTLAATSLASAAPPADNKRAIPNDTSVAAVKRQRIEQDRSSGEKTSKYEGVSWDESTSRWVAVKMIGSFPKVLGSFKQEKHAAYAIDKFSIDNSQGQAFTLNITDKTERQQIEAELGQQK